MNHVNCYPLIFKQKVVNYYNKTNQPIKSILNAFDISNGSLYNWINKNKRNSLTDKKHYNKTSKYLPHVKCYIRNYVLTRKVFDMSKLIYQLKENII